MAENTRELQNLAKDFMQYNAKAKESKVEFEDRLYDELRFFSAKLRAHHKSVKQKEKVGSSPHNCMDIWRRDERVKPQFDAFYEAKSLLHYKMKEMNDEYGRDKRCSTMMKIIERWEKGVRDIEKPKIEISYNNTGEISQYEFYTHRSEAVRDFLEQQVNHANQILREFDSAITQNDNDVLRASWDAVIAKHSACIKEYEKAIEDARKAIDVRIAELSTFPDILSEAELQETQERLAELKKLYRDSGFGSICSNCNRRLGYGEDHSYIQESGGPGVSVYYNCRR